MKWKNHKQIAFKKYSTAEIIGLIETILKLLRIFKNLFPSVITRVMLQTWVEVWCSHHKLKVGMDWNYTHRTAPVIFYFIGLLQTHCPNYKGSRITQEHKNG